MTMKKTKIIKHTLGWILALSIIYGVFSLSLSFMQRRLLYFPDMVRFVPSEWALPELRLMTVRTDDKLTLSSWYSPAKKQRKLTIVFFQGNAGLLGYRNYKVRPWLEAGYGVMLVGYRGFGNPGTPTEQGLYKDSRAAINLLLTSGVRPQSLVFYGESLGTGVAVQMATEYKIAGLILESPYTSIADVAEARYPLVPIRLLTLDKFNSIDKIGKIHVPLLIMHGTADTVIPMRFGAKLFETANQPKTMDSVDGAGHNDVYTLVTQDKILKFLDGLNAKAGARR